MNKRLGAAAGALLAAALIHPAAAASQVDGCDVILSEPGATVVTIVGPAPLDMEAYFDAPDGVATITLENGEQLAPGSYTALWDTGSSETFELACDAGPLVDPDYDPNASAPPLDGEVIEPDPEPQPTGYEPPAVSSDDYPNPYEPATPKATRPRAAAPAAAIASGRPAWFSL